jgi:ketosteroid isomerase-like protein
MFTTIDAMDWTALRAFFHPEAVYERPGYEPLTGRDRVLRFYREERVIKSGAHRIEGTVIEDDRGAAWGRITGVRTDGAAFELAFADVYRFQDGMIKVRRSHFFLPAV